MRAPSSTHLCIGLFLSFLAPSLFAACPPPGFDRAALDALKTAKFEIADDAGVSRWRSRCCLVSAIATPSCAMGSPSRRTRRGCAPRASTWPRAPNYWRA